MCIHFFVKKTILLSCFLLLAAFFAAAADESYVKALAGKIKKGDSLLVADDKFINLPSEQWDQLKNISVDNILSFELRNDTSYYYQQKSFACSLKVHIQYFTSREQELPTELKDIVLVVKYDTAKGAWITANAQYTFRNAFKVLVIVDSISSQEWGNELPPVFRIKSQILVNRKYPFSSQVAAGLQWQLQGTENNVSAGGGVSAMRVSATPVVVNNQLLLSWLPADFPGAEEYDVEWTYIDNLSSRASAFSNVSAVTDTQVDGWMRFDATRVTVNISSYAINLPYTAGYIVVRVRGAAYDVTTKVRVTTNWQYRDQNNALAYAAITAHRQEFNWQYQGVFAEEGRRKEVMSYYDASLRGRQNVTVNNSDNLAVAAESIYDNMGRPAVNILPAPLNNGKLDYYSLLNKNASGEAYSYTDIAAVSSGNTCTIGVGPLSGTSGAAMYYSGSNPFLNNANYYFSKYIPDAEGYPLAATEYTPDNTKRVRRKGGVGPALQIGSGHETRYFYSKPMQQELDRLFGMEVGNASHYQKNIMVDPNGQINISYLNAGGSPIATALAGKAPVNVDVLPSANAGAITRLNQALITKTDFSADATALNMQATAVFFAAVTGDFQVHYSISPASLITSPSAAAAFCTNCYYDMLVQVKDDCGTVIASATSAPFTGNDAVCHTGAADVTATLPVTVQKIGEYTVTYKLQLSEEVLNSQVDYYIQHNTDLTTLQQFFQDELVQADLKGCYSECSGCREKLGTLADFTTKMNTLLTKLKAEKYADYTFDVNNASVQSWISSTYTQVYNNCVALEASCSVSPCELKLEKLKGDVRPGGQYALYTYTEATGLYAYTERTINVLRFYNNASYTAIYNINYTDEAGNVIYIRNLSESDFIKAYLVHPEWADQFVQQHIEYCGYTWCKDQSYATPAYNNEVSYRFDQSLRDYISTGQKAVDKGYFNRSNLAALLDLDPFFNGGRGSTYKSAMLSDLQSLSDVLNLTLTNTAGTKLAVKNILQLVDWELYCKPVATSTTAADMVNSWTCSPATACRSLTAEWEIYRNYYLQIKSKYMAYTRQTGLPGCTSCFIGSDGLSGPCATSTASIPCPSASEFYVTEGEGTDYYDYNGYYETRIVNRPVYFVHSGGAVARQVLLDVYGEYYQLAYDPNYYPCYTSPQYVSGTSEQMTINAGEDRVLIGYHTENYVLDLSTGCYEYYEDATNYTAYFSGCSGSQGSTSVCGASICTGNYVSSYCASGTRIYANTAGSSVAATLTATPLWRGTCATTSCGPLNRCGIWPCASTSVENQWLSFEKAVVFPTSKTYYIGVSADNLMRLRVDGQTIVETSDINTFNYWHVYPITLGAGTHIISIAGNNAGGQYAFGCEIYDNTLVQLTAATAYSQLTVLYSTVNERGTTVSCQSLPASSCTTDPRRADYQNKVRVWDDYVNTQGYLSCANQSTDPSSATNQSAADMFAQLQANLQSLQSNWIDNLKSVRDEESAFAAITDVQITTLTDYLYQVAYKNLENTYNTYLVNPTVNDPLKIRGASVLPSGVTSASGHNNFTQAFTAVVGAALVSKGFGPDLLEQPYPYDKTAIGTNPSSGEVTADMCSRLTTLRARFGTGTNAQFHAWLKTELAEDYTLTETQLQDLSNRCANGCRLLDAPVMLPVVLATPVEANADHPWISCSRMSSLVSSFGALYADVPAGSKLYRILLQNYLNHTLGYALAYDEYQNFLTGCAVNNTIVLYNKPASPQVPADDFACVAGIMADVFNKAGQEYVFYIETEKRRFRNELVSKCLSNNAYVKLEGDQYEYHYTLYYYDQAGNLVKTIPPEGVKLLSDKDVALVNTFRNENPDACAESPVTIDSQDDPLNTFALFSDVLGGSNGTYVAKGAEMWLYAPGNTGVVKHVRIVTPDHKYLYQVALYNNKIWAELYSLQPDGAGAIDILQSNHAVADLSQLPVMQSWVHVYVQSGDGLPGGSLQLFVDGHLLTNLSSNIPPYPVEMVFSSNPSEATLPETETTVLRQFRLYQRVATEEEVTANYKNVCMNPEGALAVRLPLLYWSKLNTGTFCSSLEMEETYNSAALEVYGSTYNTGYNMEQAPNNFTVEFWAYPYDYQYPSTEGTTYGDPSYMQFVTYPNNDNAGNGSASVGISVGINGVSVIEANSNVFRTALRWSGSIYDWTHIAVVYTNRVPRLYINGNLVRTGLSPVFLSVVPSYNFVADPYHPYAGSIDEVRMWDYSRSIGEIQSNYSMAIPRDNAAGLLSYWPVNNYDIIMRDVTCNHRDVPLNDAAYGVDWYPASINEYVYTNRDEAYAHFLVPDHTLPSVKMYNSLNNVVQATSPDGGVAAVWYDRLGRAVFEQDAEQAVVMNNAAKYTYTKYDEIGRTVESGEKLLPVSYSGYMTEENMRVPSNVITIYGAGTNSLVSVTAYDEQPAWAPIAVTGQQANLRKRVAAAVLLSNGNNPAVNRLAGSYYSYDIAGNLADLVQENVAQSSAEAQYFTGTTGLKRISYQYDQVSGKVNKVLYQDGKWDQYYYQYLYDADNRLVKVLNSRNNYADPNLWVTEAVYRYYLHQPLARMELGKNKVQGIDYAYTLQGWLKGVNSTALDINKDMSGDGKNGTVFQNVAADAFGFTLGYFSNAYTPIGSSTPAFSLQYQAPVPDPTGAVRNYESGNQLFNGNISHSTYAVRQLESGSTAGYSYRYDQLNRLVVSNRHDGISAAATTWSNSNITQAYKESMAYDANGNISTLTRNGSAAQLNMDQLTYSYNRDEKGRLTNNRLRHVKDAVTSGSYTEDIDSQQDDNYQYDNTGNLTRDLALSVAAVKWNANGKIATITKTDGGIISYAYNTAGFRIAKTVTAAGTSVTTYYVRDIQGNVMAVYSVTATGFTWQEQHLYGGRRLGMVTPGLLVATGQPWQNDAYNSLNDPIGNGIEGKTYFELSDQLDNVLAAVSDLRIPVSSNGTTIDYYNADVVYAQGYYPFGMVQPGRSYNAGWYRYGFNGHEKSTEVDAGGNSTTAEFWQYDTRTGRRWNLDPKTSTGISDYSAFTNNPIANYDAYGDTPTLGNRIWGGVKFVGGVIGAAGSAAIGGATSWTGAGAVAGGIGFVYSADAAAAGLRQMISGEDEATITNKVVKKGLQKVGVAPATAQSAANYTDLGLSLFSGTNMYKAFTPISAETKFLNQSTQLAKADAAAVKAAAEQLPSKIVAVAKENNIFTSIPKNAMYPKIVGKYLSEMKSGAFDPTATANRVGGYIDKAGRYILSGGHHKMTAAIQYYVETGSRKFIDILLKNGRWEKNPELYNIKASPLPKTNL